MIDEMLLLLLVATVLGVAIGIPLVAWCESSPRFMKWVEKQVLR